MRAGIAALIVVLVIVGVMGISLASAYNGLITLSESIDAQWAQVENQLQRRYELIPNLVETVKGYAAHESQVFTAIADARARLAGARTPEERVAAANELESALARLLVVVETYPQLKADRQFIQLMDELAGTENRIAVERQRFNELVREYNVRIKRFPTVFLARMLGFEARPYFASDAEAQEAPDVDF